MFLIVSRKNMKMLHCLGINFHQKFTIYFLKLPVSIVNSLIQPLSDHCDFYWCCKKNPGRKKFFGIGYLFLNVWSFFFRKNQFSLSRAFWRVWISIKWSFTPIIMKIRRTSVRNIMIKIYTETNHITVFRIFPWSPNLFMKNLWERSNHEFFLAFFGSISRPFSSSTKRTTSSIYRPYI